MNFTSSNPSEGSNNMAFSPENLKILVNSREIHAFIQTATYPLFTKFNTTVLRHCLTLIPSALRTGTTLPLHGVGGTQWHVTTCNTKSCGSITHIQQHLTTNCTTSGMRALRPFGGCSRFAGPRGNNNRASVVVVEPGGTNRNETKNTGPMGVCGRANTSAMHSQCIAQPHIAD